jgi:8-oxo-dGTP diphosphatase
VPHTYDHWRPSFTCDALVLAREHGAWHVLLIERKNAPFAGSWALPGGFLDEHEDLEACARRELLEETGVEVEALAQLKAYGRLGRDPRGRTVTVAFVAALKGPPPEPAGRDDALRAAWHPVDALPALAFDHAEIVADGLAWLRR